LQGTLGHDGIADCRSSLGFRRAVILHVAAFRLFLGGTVAEPDFMLVPADLYDLEFVVAAGIEQPTLPRAVAWSRGLRLIALVTFVAPLVDLRNVAETFDPIRQFDKCPKRRDARHSAADQIAHFVLLKPTGPDVVHLFDAERHAARRRIDLQHFGFDRIPFFVDVARILDSPGPGDVADVDQTIETLLDFQERPEFGQVPDAAADHRAARIFIRELLPRIGLRLFHAERNTPLVRIDAQHNDIDVVAHINDFRRVYLALRPAHLADVHQALDARFHFDEGALVRQPYDLSSQLLARGVAFRRRGPGIGQQLLAPQRHAALF